MYFITFIYLVLLQDSLSTLKFNGISVTTIPDSINIIIEQDNIRLVKNGYVDVFLKIDSTYTYININQKIIGIKDEISTIDVKTIHLYFTDYPKNRFILNKLRSINDVHDFMFYYAGIERAEFKEYFKAVYNFKKAYELGVRTPILKSNLDRIGTLLKKPTGYDEKRSSIEVKEIKWIKRNIKVPTKQYFSTDTWFLIGVIFIFTLFLVIRKNKKVREKRIQKFDKLLKKEPIVEQKVQIKKEIKKIEISEKKKQLLDITKALEQERKKAPRKEFVQEKMYSVPEQFETEHLNQNLGEVELALNLQSIRRRHTTPSSKYEEINELKMQNLTTEEIAKQLNITVTEVKLFNSFREEN